jgi:hypothetical protein
MGDGSPERTRPTAAAQARVDERRRRDHTVLKQEEAERESPRARPQVSTHTPPPSDATPGTRLLSPPWRRISVEGGWLYRIGK